MKSVIVLCENNGISPCYQFTGVNSEKTSVISEEELKGLFKAASKHSDIELLFLIGGKVPLSELMASVLKEMGGQIICPLLDRKEQDRLRIPFSPRQMVIASNLESFIKNAGSISGRSLTLHVEKQEIPYLAESILSVQKYVGSITIRLKNPQLLDDAEIENYKRQLAALSDMSLIKQASGVENRLNIHNLRIQDYGIGHCPAEYFLVTIGPNGKVYPCPAFYAAACQPLAESLSEYLDRGSRTESVFAGCKICSDKQCPGCRFLETNETAEKNNLCHIYRAELQVHQELYKRVAQSGYLFDCLRTLKTKEEILNIVARQGESVFANRQVNDITYEEFVQALRDIDQVANAIKRGQSDGIDMVLSQWGELPDVPPNSRKAAFRILTKEIIEELQMLTEYKVKQKV